jgi:hypothetical protein
MIYEITTKNIKHSTVLQKRPRHVYTSQISSIFTEYTYTVTVDTGTVRDMLG